MRFLGQRGDVPPCSPPPMWSWCPPLGGQRDRAEALRAGRPLVASRTGGIPGLTGEDAAVLVPPGTRPLAAAVLAVLDDPRLAARLGEAARARAAALPGEAAAVDAALALYQRVAGLPAAV
jgi:glycosyltransferase involved in cell wall biosynthesis